MLNVFKLTETPMSVHRVRRSIEKSGSEVHRIITEYMSNCTQNKCANVIQLEHIAKPINAIKLLRTPLSPVDDSLLPFEQ